MIGLGDQFDRVRIVVAPLVWIGAECDQLTNARLFLWIDQVDRWPVELRSGRFLKTGSEEEFGHIGYIVASLTPIGTLPPYCHYYTTTLTERQYGGTLVALSH